MTLEERERVAYMAGDTERADLLGQLLDTQDPEQKCEKLSDIVEGIRGRITEANWNTGNKAELRELIVGILFELEAMK